MILGLPDAQEGIDDELEDLEEEASCITEAYGDGGAAADAMLIEMVAASMFAALSSKQGQAPGRLLEKSNLKSVILCIMKRWCHHELFDALLDEGCKKEEARLAEGKRADLLHYELMEWEREEGENPDAMRQFINQLLTPAYGRSVETIKEMLLSLNRYNIEHHHLFDVPLLELYKRLDGEAQGVSAGGDNRGIMTGGDLNAGFHFTDPQAEMLAKAIAAKVNQPLLQ